VLSPGVTYVRDVRKTPRSLMIHVIVVDLDASKATFLVTPPSGSTAAPLCTRTTAKFLKDFNVQIAINGDGFTYPKGVPNKCGPGSDPVKPNGFAASGGTVYNTGGAETTFYVNRKNSISINVAPGNPLEAVSGDRLLVANGKPVSGLDTTLLNPRSALGISQNGRRLMLMVVDGRQPGYSEGVYFTELASLLIYYGAFTAMNLDGGGSSTLVVQGTDKLPLVLNSPIDSLVIGQQRAVANHLGLFITK
jgi:exopolysaccharide biosynthesis protein